MAAIPEIYGGCLSAGKYLSLFMSCLTKVDFQPLTYSHRDDLNPYLKKVQSGISEFTFAGLYLFRKTYDYAVGFCEDILLIQGKKDGKTFCHVPLGIPTWRQIDHILQHVDFLKNLSEEQAALLEPQAPAHGLRVVPDRDNWDYLYDTVEMAELAGKRFHKKRNLVHQFYHLYTDLEMFPLDESNLPQAFTILKTWVDLHPDNNDYEAAAEALQRHRELGLSGAVFFVDSKPVGYTLGEPSSQAGDYIIHFEKADPSYKGVYQAIFQRFARSLVSAYSRINREQDLGDQGLRQAKETYRPTAFIKKYRLERAE